MQMYKNRSKLLFAGIVGNLLEWFDFAIYGFFALTIGKVFFPKEDPVAQVIAAFGVFAIGFLMRPIGGLLLGYIGDKYGRQKAMLISVAAMAIPTFFVGILPGYETLGLAAPILLLLLRMIQGLSVGGEYTTSIVYMLEHTEPRRRGFVGAFAVSGAVGGILLGSAFGAFLASTLSPEALQEWGWRVPFLMGLILGLAGLYLRREPTAQGAPVVRSSNPLSDSLRFHRRVMLQISGLTMMNAVAFYMIFVYLVSWLETVDGIAPENALRINTISLLILIPIMIFSGWLSDRIGCKRILVAATCIISLLAWPLFTLLHNPDVAMIYIGELGFAVIIGFYLGAQPAFIVKVIPSAVRCTAAGLGYNVTLGIVGGLTPMVATWLVSRTHDDLSPAYMIIFAGLCSLVALMTMHEKPEQLAS